MVLKFRCSLVCSFVILLHMWLRLILSDQVSFAHVGSWFKIKSELGNTYPCMCAHIHIKFMIKYSSAQLQIYDQVLFSTTNTDTWLLMFALIFSERIVSMQFMRKYIHVAKALTPTLTRPASELIAEEYTKIRSQDSLQQDNLARVRTLYAGESQRWYKDCCFLGSQTGVSLPIMLLLARMLGHLRSSKKRASISLINSIWSAWHQYQECCFFSWYSM